SRSIWRMLTLPSPAIRRRPSSRTFTSAASACIALRTIAPSRLSPILPARSGLSCFMRSTRSLGLRMSAFAALVSSPSGKISDIFTTPWLVVEAMLDDCPAQGFPAPLPLFGQKTDDRPLALLLQPETGQLDLLRQGQGRKFLFQHVLAMMGGHPGVEFRNLF